MAWLPNEMHNLDLSENITPWTTVLFSGPLKTLLSLFLVQEKLGDEYSASAAGGRLCYRRSGCRTRSTAGIFLKNWLSGVFHDSPKFSVICGIDVCHLEDTTIQRLWRHHLRTQPNDVLIHTQLPCHPPEWLFPF